MVKAIDLRAPERNDTPVRRRGVAIAGRKLPLVRSGLLNQIRLPERILLVEIQMEGTPFIAVSYHAPPGVDWKIIKPQQAVAFASWLCSQDGPLLFGADANTPLIDSPDFAKTRTHWHTGDRRLDGMVQFVLLISDPREYVGAKWPHPAFALLDFQIDSERFAEKSDVGLLRKPRREISVLSRPCARYRYFREAA
jgi:hypothetical protein